MNIKKIPFLNFVVPTFNPLLAYPTFLQFVIFNVATAFLLSAPQLRQTVIS
jgi:prepilin signal peptidase PulO-like enzyme (type II secretory pathway)